MHIETGWRLYSADFSINASDPTRMGRVSLVRSPDDVKRWHKITDEMDEEDRPELYVDGKGLTIEVAVLNANLRASHLPELV